jgi:DNA adenine methylase
VALPAEPAPPPQTQEGLPDAALPLRLGYSPNGELLRAEVDGGPGLARDDLCGGERADRPAGAAGTAERVAHGTLGTEGPENAESARVLTPQKLSGANPPVKRHGGKSYLAERIIALMPPRAQNPNAPATEDLGWVHYVEPFAGGLAVLLALDPEGIAEVVNDLDGELANFWCVLRSREHFPELVRLAALTPVSLDEFERACQGTRHLPPPERALAFLIRNRQSRQALGQDFVTPVRNRTRRGMDEHCSAWLSAVEGLPAVHARLRRVRVLNLPALEVIRAEDGPRSLLYSDPPYLHETRTATDAYDHEMTEADHRELLEALADIKGRFLLSGYHSPLYDRFAEARGWHCTEFVIDNKAGGGRTKRTMTECVWTNYVPPEEEARREGGA